MSDKLPYTHNGMIDLMVANPRITQKELAARFGYTEGWVSQIVRSDGFQELYAARRKELVDPAMMQAIETRLEALAARSIDVLQEKLDTTENPEIALKSLDIATRSLGYGVKAGGVQINQQFVVAMPTKGVNSEAWIGEHAPRVVNG